MTDNEIIKALKCCKDLKCSECPKKGNLFVTDCDVKLCDEVLELIKRQQAEIEELKAKNEKIYKAWSEDLQDKIKFIHEQNEQLDDLRLEKYGIKAINKAVPTTRAVKRYIELKAYKEFAERLKEKSVFLEDGERYIGDAVKAKDIDNLVKEMTEGSK